MRDNVQGVFSTIKFPLGQDELAISKAIFSLLEEGWNFGLLTKTTISLTRKWEVKEQGEGYEEVSQ